MRATCPRCKKDLFVRGDGRLPRHLRSPFRPCDGSMLVVQVVAPKPRPSTTAGLLAYCSVCLRATPHEVLWYTGLRQCLCCMDTSGPVEAMLARARECEALALG